MIVPSGAVRVLVATQPIDFRKGMDGIAALVRERLSSDPFRSQLSALLEGLDWTRVRPVRVRTPSAVS